MDSKPSTGDCSFEIGVALGIGVADGIGVALGVGVFHSMVGYETGGNCMGLNVGSVIGVGVDLRSMGILAYLVPVACGVTVPPCDVGQGVFVLMTVGIQFPISAVLVAVKSGDGVAVGVPVEGIVGVGVVDGVGGMTSGNGHKSGVVSKRSTTEKELIAVFPQPAMKIGSLMII